MTDHDRAEKPETGVETPARAAPGEASDEADKTAREATGVDPQGSITSGDSSNAAFHRRVAEEDSNH